MIHVSEIFESQGVVLVGRTEGEGWHPALPPLK